MSPAIAAAFAGFDSSASLAARGLSADRGPLDPAKHHSFSCGQGPVYAVPHVPHLLVEKLA